MLQTNNINNKNNNNNNKIANNNDYNKRNKIGHHIIEGNQGSVFKLDANTGEQKTYKRK